MRDNTPAILRRSAIKLAVVLFGLSSATSGSGQERPPDPAEVVRVLTSPAAFGRGYTKHGHAVAARYIREQFIQAGLQPAVPGYLQRFTVYPDLIRRTPTLLINDAPLPLATAFIPLPGSASGSAEDAAVVRAGHGLFDIDAGVDDYANRDVAGSVVLVEDGIPDSLVQRGASRSIGRIAAKAENAARAGAVAILVAVDRLTYATSMPDVPIPVFQVLRFAVSGDVSAASFAFDTDRNVPTETANVLGILPGMRPDSVIVLGAHYDHLGGIGDEAYFGGANDNASGTALLIDLAYALAETAPHQHTIVFAAFSGEELGLFGSEFFVRHAPVPLSQIRLMLNFDMVASGREGIVAAGGTNFPDDYELLRAVNDSLGIGPIRARSATPISDHFAFASRGIPALYLYTNRGTQPYHHVDDVRQTLEWDDYLRVRELVISFLARVR